MPNWDTDTDGLIILHPVVGHETALLGEVGCGVRVEFVDRAEDIGRASRFLAFAMTAKQARELAQDLLEMAGMAASVPPGTIPS